MLFLRHHGWVNWIICFFLCNASSPKERVWDMQWTPRPNLTPRADSEDQDRESEWGCECEGFRFLPGGIRIYFYVYLFLPGLDRFVDMVSQTRPMSVIYAEKIKPVPGMAPPGAVLLCQSHGVARWGKAGCGRRCSSMFSNRKELVHNIISVEDTWKAKQRV